MCIRDRKIDNMDQALERAVKNGVKNLVVQPTHLMHGAEYDELSEAVEKYKDKFESVKIAEPLLGEVGSDATVVNEDKKAVAEILTEEAVEKAGYAVSYTHLDVYKRQVRDNWYLGVTNIGCKPTIEGKNPIGAETYIIDFGQDVYGQDIMVELHKFVRPEMKFDSRCV